jgi:predicted dehydrogenase
VEKIKVGIIGCGNISDIYLEKIKLFHVLEIKSCSDLDMDRARIKANKFDIQACTVDEILSDKEIGIIVNLTPPSAHADIALKSVEAGKSIYNEKPITIDLEEARKILDLAEKAKLRVGCAPDTFLGAGLQTCRQVIDSGMIGKPVAATAFMLGRGPEGWHPDPEFFYKKGGGPMFDMGPYYLTALVNLMGPVRRVTGITQVSFPERIIGSEGKRGQKIVVETPTHLAGLLEFVEGGIGTLITSFDVWTHSLPRIEIYGSEGTLRVPDPNTFGGKVEIWRPGTNKWEEVNLSHGYSENTRGLGVADLAYGLISGRPHRANGQLGYHVLEIMHSVIKASSSDRHIHLTSKVERPKPMDHNLPYGVLDY